MERRRKHIRDEGVEAPREMDFFDPEGITIPAGRRGINEDVMVGLVESIKAHGVRNPISVRLTFDADGEEAGPVLVAGLHRLEACKRLGLRLIQVAIVPNDPRGARMWEISENLHRAELSEAERRQHIAEWVKLVAEREAAKVLHGATPQGGVQHTDRAIRKAAKDLGISPATVSRAVAAESLAPDVKAAADAAGLGTMARVTVAREPESGRLEAVQRMQEPQIVPEPPGAPEKPARRKWGSGPRLAYFSHQLVDGVFEYLAAIPPEDKLSAVAHLDKMRAKAAGQPKPKPEAISAYWREMLDG